MEGKSGLELLLQQMYAEQFCKNYREKETKDIVAASRCSHSMIQQQQPQQQNFSPTVDLAAAFSVPVGVPVGVPQSVHAPHIPAQDAFGCLFLVTPFVLSSWSSRAPTCFPNTVRQDLRGCLHPYSCLRPHNPLSQSSSERLVAPAASIEGMGWDEKVLLSGITPNSSVGPSSCWGHVYSVHIGSTCATLVFWPKPEQNRISR